MEIWRTACGSGGGEVVRQNLPEWIEYLNSLSRHFTLHGELHQHPHTTTPLRASTRSVHCHDEARNSNSTDIPLPPLPPPTPANARVLRPQPPTTELPVPRSPHLSRARCPRLRLSFWSTEEPVQTRPHRQPGRSDRKAVFHLASSQSHAV